MGTRILPRDLKEAIVYFSDQDVAVEFLRDIRWPNGVECPTCGSKEVYYISTQRRWKCKNKHPKQQFSVKNGTMFEDSPIGLDKWLPATWLVTNCKNGISSYELSRDLGVTQRTAWFMLHRVRHAMRVLSFEKFAGETEADEAFIGGKIKNMHKKAKRKAKAHDGDNWGKSVVIGLLNRECGEVRAKVDPNRMKKHMKPFIDENVAPHSKLYTDEFPGYAFCTENIAHEIVNHLESYVNGRVHTNGMEELLVSPETDSGRDIRQRDPAHLFRYLDAFGSISAV